jgi:hypothetical protein
MEKVRYGPGCDIAKTSPDVELRGPSGEDCLLAVGCNNACPRVTADPGIELRGAGQSAREAQEGCFDSNES